MSRIRAWLEAELIQARRRTYYFRSDAQTVKGGESSWGQIVSFLVQ